MGVGPGHPIRAWLARAFVVVTLSMLGGSTFGAATASAAPTPVPPVLKPKPVPKAPGTVKPPLAPPKEPKGPLKPYVPPTPPKIDLTPETKITSKEKTPKQKEEEKKKAAEREEEELQNDKGKGACRHGFGSSITNKLSVSCMTEQAVDKIFGLPDGFGTQKLLRGLLRVPDFVAGSPAEGVSNAEWLTKSIAFALLMAVVTFALFHYFAAGMLSGGGSGMFIDGVTRCVGAALLILAWPFIFENVVNITNVITNTLIPESSIDGGVGMLANAAEAGGTLGAGLLVMIVFAVLMLILLMVKIGLLTGLMIAFVGMPLALALWPVPSLSGPATYAVRFVGMVLTVVILWAVCLRIFGAVSTEFRAWGGHNLGVGGKLLLPLVGLGSLLALLSIPRHAVQMWNVAPQKGTVSSMFQYAASSMIANSVRGGGKAAAGSRKVGGGQHKPGGGRPGGSPGGKGASGGGGGGRTGGTGGGGQMGGVPAAPAVAASAMSGQAKSGAAGPRSKGSGSGSGSNPRRGGSGSAPKRGKQGGGGNPRRGTSQSQRQGGSAKPGGGGGATRTPAGAGGGRGGSAPRPQGEGGGAQSTGSGNGGRSGGKPSSPRGSSPAGGNQPRPNPRGGGSPAAGSRNGKPAPRSTTSHQKPPPPSK